MKYRRKPNEVHAWRWKVEYYKSDIDRLRDIKTVDEFDNFESAKDFTIMKIGNHMGAVRLIHPDVD